MRLSGRVLVLGVLTLFTCAALAAYLLGRDDDEAWSTATDAASGIGVSHPSAWPVQTFEYSVRIRTGTNVSGDDWDVLARVIRSLRFTGVESG